MSASARRVLAALAASVVLALSACAPGGSPSSGPGDTGDAQVEERFDDAQTGRWDVFDDGEAASAIAGGRLLLTLNVSEELTWSLLQDDGAEFADLALDVDATALAGPTDNSYGLLFRYADRFNFYSFDVSSDGYYSLRLRRGTSAKDVQVRKLIDWTPTPAVRPGLNQTNHLRLVARGEQFTLIVNGQTVGQATDASLANGRVGVSAGSFIEPGVQVAFDNLIVSRP